MAFTVASKGRRRELGDRFIRTFVIDEVTSAGSSVDLRPYGVHTIEDVIGANDTQAAEGPIVQKNSATLSQTEDDPGRIWVQTASGTDDVTVTLVYR